MVTCYAGGNSMLESWQGCMMNMKNSDNGRHHYYGNRDARIATDKQNT